MTSPFKKFNQNNQETSNEVSDKDSSVNSVQTADFAKPGFSFEEEKKEKESKKQPASVDDFPKLIE